MVQAWVAYLDNAFSSCMQPVDNTHVALLAKARLSGIVGLLKFVLCPGVNLLGRILHRVDRVLQSLDCTLRTLVGTFEIHAANQVLDHATGPFDDESSDHLGTTASQNNISARKSKDDILDELRVELFSSRRLFP